MYDYQLYLNGSNLDGWNSYTDALEAYYAVYANGKAELRYKGEIIAKNY